MEYYNCDFLNVRWIIRYSLPVVCQVTDQHRGNCWKSREPPIACIKRRARGVSWYFPGIHFRNPRASLTPSARQDVDRGAGLSFGEVTWLAILPVSASELYPTTSNGKKIVDGRSYWSIEKFVRLLRWGESPTLVGSSAEDPRSVIFGATRPSPTLCPAFNWSRTITRARGLLLIFIVTREKESLGYSHAISHDENDEYSLEYRILNGQFWQRVLRLILSVSVSLPFSTAASIYAYVKRRMLNASILKFKGARVSVRFLRAPHKVQWMKEIRMSARIETAATAKRGMPEVSVRDGR